MRTTRSSPGRALAGTPWQGASRLRASASSCSSAAPVAQLDNLYVVDTSLFPSIGAVNPALTAIANALRVGDHLLARLA